MRHKPYGGCGEIAIYLSLFFFCRFLVVCDNMLVDSVFRAKLVALNKLPENRAEKYCQHGI